MRVFQLPKISDSTINGEHLSDRDKRGPWQDVSVSIGSASDSLVKEESLFKAYVCGVFSLGPVGSPKDSTVKEADDKHQHLQVGSPNNINTPLLSGIPKIPPDYLSKHWAVHDAEISLRLSCAGRFLTEPPIHACEETVAGLFPSRIL
uniref:Uncharacterized protein n=1 Tax=Knipowitschia caucasica TaxID=637954 RepID=A0AAV2L626_KNICA